MTRSSEEDRRIIELFEAALDQPSSDRHAWLVLNAGDDVQLLSAVLAMLELDESDDHAVRTGAAASGDLPPVRHPEQIGAYRITRVIGEGGMGVVYEGERTKGDFEHKVAIKVIRPGLLSPQLVNRFSNERKILASLTHPGIAKLFDGGELEDGSPFIIMEYIDGVPITKWIEQNTLSEAETLSLFLAVLDAIEHAHQNLIVHRDITPSNVLVTSAGQPKLIDFGIAKPQVDEMSEPPEGGSTSLISLSFTPGFAAPEREQGAAPNILSDVFSLGRLLQAMMGKRTLGRDLRSIIDKACQATPSDRYASTQTFREDIQALMSERPVSANPQNGVGRSIYFFRRHPISISLAGLALLSLIGGLITMSSLYSTAERERQNANMRFNELHTLANTMMFDIYDDIDTLPGATSAKAELAETAQAYLDSLSDDETASRDVQLDTARGYIRLAAIQGSPSMSSYHSSEDALVSLDAAEDILTRLIAAHPSDDDIRLALGQTYFEQAHIANNPYQQFDKARQLLDASISTLRGGDAPVAPELEMAAMSSQGLRATVIGWQGEMETAVEEFEQLIIRAREMTEDQPDSADLQTMLGSFLRNQSELLTRQDDFERAESVLAEAVERSKTLLATDPENIQHRRNLAISHWRHAFTLYNLGRHEESLSEYEQSMSITEAMVEADPDNENAISLLGTLRGEIILPLIGLERFDEAEAVGLESLAVQETAYNANPDIARFQRNMLVQHYQLFELYTQAEDTGKACSSLSEMARFAGIMTDGGHMAEADLSALRGLNPSFQACGLPEL